MNLNKIDSLNKINIYCYSFFALYAIITLSVFGYGVYFLQELNYSYLAIGVTIGISALIASIIQPFIGRLADIRHYSWKNILIVLNIILLISSLGVYIAPHNLLILLFGLMIIVFGCMYSFINQAVFYYEKHGTKTNFGVSRGFGSLTYMIFASLVGIFLAESGVMLINALSTIAAIIMLLVLYLAPYYDDDIDVNDNANIVRNKNRQKRKRLKNNVIFKYPIFGLVFLSVTALMIFHDIFTGYMIAIFQNVGGNITDVAFGNSIAAFLELPTMFLFAKLLKRISAQKLLLIASIFYLIRSILVLTASDILGIYISLTLQMVSFAIMIPASIHITDELIREEDKYQGQAFMGVTQTIGIIFANFLGGHILHSYSVNLLLVILVIISVIGCIFAFSALLAGKKQEK